jgi:hypothetical protein
MSGDLSAFDGLVRTAEEGLTKARAIAPPAAAAAYHAELLAVLGAGLGMLRQLRAAMGGKDPDALSALGTTAGALRARADALESKAKALKAAAGL